MGNGQDDLSTRRAVRPPDRIARLLDGLELGRRFRSGGRDVARRVSAPDLRMRRVRALRTTGAHGRPHGGLARHRGRYPGRTLGRAGGLERRAGGARRVAGPNQAGGGHQLFGTFGPAGRRPIEHPLGLRRDRRGGRLLQTRSSSLSPCTRQDRRAGSRGRLRRRLRLRLVRRARRGFADVLA